VCEMFAISRRFERDLIPYALETDCPLEDPVESGPVSHRKIPVEMQKPGNRLI
jgi:hypothetical protein